MVRKHFLLFAFCFPILYLSNVHSFIHSFTHLGLHIIRTLSISTDCVTWHNLSLKGRPYTHIYPFHPTFSFYVFHFVRQIFTRKKESQCWPLIFVVQKIQMSELRAALVFYIFRQKDECKIAGHAFHS